MAEKKVIIGFEIGGQKEAEGFLADLGKAAATLVDTIGAPIEMGAFDTSEFDKGLAELEAITKEFGGKRQVEPNISYKPIWVMLFMLLYFFILLFAYMRRGKRNLCLHFF